MAHDEIGLQGFTFNQVIEKVPDELQFRGDISDSLPVNTAMLNAAITLGGTFNKFFINYLATKSKENPLPGSWAGLVNDYDTFAAITTPRTPGTQQDHEGFKKLREQLYQFTEAITNPDFVGTVELKDWSIWTPSGDFNPPDGLTTGVLSDFAEKALDHFLSTFSYVDALGNDITSGDPPGIPSNFLTDGEFYRQLYNFLAVTAVVQDATAIGFPTPTNTKILSYEEIFNTFFPGGTDNDGQTLGERFTIFIEETIAEEGFFLPSLHVDEWYNEVQNNFLLPLKGTELLTTTKSTDGLRRTNILNRIFTLLVDLIQILQQVAAAQARRLQFLTQFQQSYTSLLNKIPIFVRGDSDIQAIDGLDNPPTGPDDIDDEDKTRGDLNTLNATLSEQIRGRRSVIQDRAKAIQSNVNQSNDAVTQQANIATSLIQQLTTLLNSIFR